MRHQVWWQACLPSRRIGGLENPVLAMETSLNPSRRIGGLESLRLVDTNAEFPSRRIGGLETLGMIAAISPDLPAG